MIPRPTTAQILRDCRRELSQVIATEVTSETAQVSLQQLDAILENCAVRAEHEVAWMVDEAESGLAYAAAVADALGDDDLASSCAEAGAARSGSLHLEDVIGDLDRSNAVMSRAIEAAVAADDRPLIDRGATLFGERAARERQVMAAWGLVGRG